MFCKICGTVLDAKKQCFKCNKKQEPEPTPDNSTLINSKATG